jgi:hypothetical protein
MKNCSALVVCFIAVTTSTLAKLPDDAITIHYTRDSIVRNLKLVNPDVELLPDRPIYLRIDDPDPDIIYAVNLDSNKEFLIKPESQLLTNSGTAVNPLRFEIESVIGSDPAKQTTRYYYLGHFDDGRKLFLSIYRVAPLQYEREVHLDSIVTLSYKTIPTTKRRVWKTHKGVDGKDVGEISDETLMQIDSTIEQ